MQYKHSIKRGTIYGVYTSISRAFRNGLLAQSAESVNCIFAQHQVLVVNDMPIFVTI